MTFRDWQHLSPTEAGREVLRRASSRLVPAQQRAAIAQLLSEAALVARFEAAKGRGPLAGVPYLAKDLFDVGGMPTYAGSTFLPEVRPTPANDGAFVHAMTRSGAVLAGKTHLHEFAYGITGENPHYGDCEHPHFAGRTTGGSSSGSAAVVAAGIVPLALASDTGGSVRLPAAFCGLYGFRLTPRDPWISDAVPLAPSYDTAGWFTADPGALHAVLDALVGFEPGQREPRGCTLEMTGLDAEVAIAVRDAAGRLAPPAPAALRDALHRGFARSAETYNTIVALEAWEVHRRWAEHYRERYSPVVWQRLMRVQNVTATQAAVADAHTAELRALWAQFFREYDFLILPASPSPALTKAGCTLENRGRILALTAPASIGGLPVLTIPVPLPSGLTTGLQIIVNTPKSPAVKWVLQQTPPYPHANHR